MSSPDELCGDQQAAAAWGVAEPGRRANGRGLSTRAPDGCRQRGRRVVEWLTAGRFSIAWGISVPAPRLSRRAMTESPTSVHDPTWVPSPIKRTGP